jgi:hypothetical protein
MLCPICHTMPLPDSHPPARDPYARPICDECYVIQLRAAQVARRIVDSIHRRIGPRILAFRRGH